MWASVTVRAVNQPAWMHVWKRKKNTRRTVKQAFLHWPDLLFFQFLNVPMFRNVTLKCLTEIAGVSVNQYEEQFVNLFTLTMCQLKEVSTRTQLVWVLLLLIALSVMSRLQVASELLHTKHAVLQPSYCTWGQEQQTIKSFCQWKIRHKHTLTKQFFLVHS